MLKRDRISFFSIDEDNHIVNPALVLPKPWLGRMRSEEIFRFEFFIFWKMNEDRLEVLRLIPLDYYEFMKIPKSMLEFRLKRRMYLNVIPVRKG